MPATINDIALQGPDEALSPAELRQRACTELLRQAAQRDGLLPADDAVPQDGAITEAAQAAIEQWLAQHLPEVPVDEAACRRHFAAQPQRWAQGERALVRHILFAVTPGVPLAPLRQRAEACLLNLRVADSQGPAFALAADEWSNCPSAAQGGELGWLGAADCAPEFAREVLGQPEVGVLPRLVCTRFGLHVVEVLARDPGVQPTFEAVREAVALHLQQHHFATALGQTLRQLAAQSTVCGVALEADDAPLMQ